MWAGEGSTLPDEAARIPLGKQNGMWGSEHKVWGSDQLSTPHLSLHLLIIEMMKKPVFSLKHFAVLASMLSPQARQLLSSAVSPTSAKATEPQQCLEPTPYN